MFKITRKRSSTRSGPFGLNLNPGAVYPYDGSGSGVGANAEEARAVAASAAAAYNSPSNAWGGANITYMMNQQMAVNPH
jgi:hypothetical protein